MFDPRRHAAALLAVLILAAPASAPAAEPALLAQIEDATPTPAPQPPLSEEPPAPLSGDGGEEEEPAGGDGEEQPQAEESLPETGLEAGLLALLGLGLVASGGGLRLKLRRHAG